MMLIERISDNIFESKEFKKDLNKLVTHATALSTLISNKEDLTDESLLKLAQSAVHFSGTKNVKYRETAHTIAVLIAKIKKREIYLFDDALSLIWTRLGNFPTKKFALQDYNNKNLGFLSWARKEIKEEENTIQLYNDRRLVLTDFQVNVWNSLSKGDVTTITAPTSAGKSYALQNFLINEVSKSKNFWACYIVPTRSLINQVSASLTKIARDFNQLDEELTITSIPINKDELETPKGIYVLTQERLQVLMEETKIIFNIVIVDEAQMIGDNSRGVILQSVLENLLKDSPSSKVLFGSPFTKNPDFFQNLLITERLPSEPVITQESPVLQNIIIVESDAIDLKKLKVHRFQEAGKKPMKIGETYLPSDVSNPDHLLPHIAHYFGKDDQNLIYSNGPAECEEIAQLISQLLSDEQDKIPASIKETRGEFSNFIKTHINPDYILAETILSGVAFHYGNMPSIIRKTIEDYYERGIISYLICTSTLLHGVNFPAKNLFLENPLRGGDTPISSIDFWNLVGRAGRLSQDIEGNIFVVNQTKWKSNPLEGEKSQQVSSSYYDTIFHSTPDLFNFASNREHSSGKEELIETTFQKLIKDFDNGNLEHSLKKSLKPLPDEDQDNYKQRFEVLKTDYINLLSEVKNNITIPKETYHKHINISVYRQQELYEYLVKKITKKGPEDYMPYHPKQYEASKSYTAIVYRILKTIDKKEIKKLNKGKEHLFIGSMIQVWTSGTSLPIIINNYHDYKKKKNKTGQRKISSSIRECLDLIEQDLRFKYVKYIRCYNDMLALALKDTNNEKYIDKIINIPLYLELGASSDTMVNLIGLGISRTTAGVISNLAIKDKMNPKQCISWLKKSNLRGLGVSEISITEINKVIR